ncbi:hypothetical protein VNO77_06870 [Canavalia gladiata]|uniref:Uncharacterized protein n=1 Tax=Canavalia gladiata TaxID=3824 RepID=A0AAN9QWB7_CANGL
MFKESIITTECICVERAVSVDEAKDSLVDEGGISTLVEIMEVGLQRHKKIVASFLTNIALRPRRCCCSQLYSLHMVDGGQHTVLFDRFCGIWTRPWTKTLTFSSPEPKILHLQHPYSSPYILLLNSMRRSRI